jgi:DNA uptake protein ComE-like DNA-binding protein
MRKSLLFALAAIACLVFSNWIFGRLRRRFQQAEPRTSQQAEVIEITEGRRRVSQGPESSHWTAEGTLDLNSASQEELVGLHGIDPSLAERIVENRPYATKIDLVGRMVLPETVYKEIKHAITVRRPA